MKYPKLLLVNFNKQILFGLMALAVSCGYLSASHSSHTNHNEHRVDTDSRLSGYSLEHEFWSAVQNHHKDILTELISSIFLGGNAQGNFDFDAEMAKLRNLSISDFTISNVVESQDEDIRIISYDFVAAGATPINDHRISVWQRKKHKHHQFFWQLISHSSYGL